MRKNFNEELRATDPIADEPGLSATELQAMRREIVGAATSARDAGWSPWKLRPMSLRMALACALALGIFIGTLFGPARQESTQPRRIEQRQLQFDTPGGTRVIWVLNSDLNL